MKILVIQQKMIGDVLVSSVICNNLKLMYPDAQIEYLIYPFTKPVVENNPNIDAVILFEEKYRKSKIALFQFLLTIKKRKYDIVIDAYGKLESNLVVFFSGAKTKIGFHKKHTAFLYTKTIAEITKASSNAGIAIDNRLNLIETLSPKITLESKPKIYLTPEEIENGRKILQQNNIDFSKKTYMIGVLGSGATKTYPSVYMASLLDLIVVKTNATLLFNYIPSQKKEAKAIYDLCKKETQKNIAIELIPRSIREFLSITSHCNALIGNEGGAVNMAKAIGKPTFTIFSTWIIKEAWNSFEDEKSTVSVHLKDFKPDLYGDKTAKEMKNQAMELYHQFSPDLIVSKLEKFVDLN